MKNTIQQPLRPKWTGSTGATKNQQQNLAWNQIYSKWTVYMEKLIPY